MFTQFVEGVKLGALLVGQDGGIQLYYSDRWLSDDEDHAYDPIVIGWKGHPITMDDILTALNKIEKHSHHYMVEFYYTSGGKGVQIEWGT